MVYWNKKEDGTTTTTTSPTTAFVTTAGPDLYGQMHPVETDALIATKVQEFWSEFNTNYATSKTRNQKKAKHALLAREKCSHLTTNEFITLFLRCECYNVANAIHRYLKYWDKRIEIFGPERGYQDITYDTMTAEDKVAIHCGYVNIMEREDDRSYAYINESKHDGTLYERHDMLRAVWYLVHKALQECTELQQRGMIVISFAGDASLSQFDPKLDQLVIGSIRGCLPVRLSGIHICQPPDFFRIVWPILKTFLSKRLSKRVTIHSGSTDVICETLIEKYNFKRDDIPTDLGGSRDISKNRIQ